MAEDLASAGSSAIEKLGGPDADVDSAEPEETQASAQAETQPQAPAESEGSEFYEHDYRGQGTKVKLSREHVDSLIDAYYSYADLLRQQQQQPKAEPKAEPKPDFSDDPIAQLRHEFQGQLEELRGGLQEQGDGLSKFLLETRQNQLQKEFDDAFNAVEEFRALSGDKEATRMIKMMMIAQSYQDGNIAPTRAAQNAQKFVRAVQEAAKRQYVTGKAQQARGRAPTGGATQTGSPKPFGVKELNEGLVKQSALQRMLASMTE